MSIHQISVAYQLDQDRLLLRVRSVSGELFELWLTRRMMLRLWQPLQKTAVAASLGLASRDSMILPEAQDMMRQTLRRQAMEKAELRFAFDENARQRPLGDEPMLVAAVDIRRETIGQVELVLRDTRQRSMSLRVSPDLLSNLLSLLEEALQRSQWGLALQQTERKPATPEAQTTKRVLN